MASTGSRFFLSSLALMLLLTVSVSGQGLNGASSCDTEILLAQPFRRISNRLGMLPREVTCPASRAGRCSVTFEAKSSILRKTTKLCAGGSYMITCEDNDQISISSSEDSFEVPCGYDHPQDAYNIDVCAPPTEGLNMIFQSDQLCGYSRFRSPAGELFVEQRPIFPNIMYLSRTGLCHHSPVAVGAQNGTIVSGYEAGDPEQMYNCPSYIYMENGSNKFCLQSVEFTTSQGGPELTVSAGDQQLTFSASNPVPSDTRVCIDVDIKVTIKMEPSNQWQPHTFIVRYNAFRD